MGKLKPTKKDKDSLYGFKQYKYLYFTWAITYIVAYILNFFLCSAIKNAKVYKKLKMKPSDDLLLSRCARRLISAILMMSKVVQAHWIKPAFCETIIQESLRSDSPKVFSSDEESDQDQSLSTEEEKMIRRIVSRLGRRKEKRIPKLTSVFVSEHPNPEFKTERPYGLKIILPPRVPVPDQGGEYMEPLDPVSQFVSWNHRQEETTKFPWLDTKSRITTNNPILHSRLTLPKFEHLTNQKLEEVICGVVVKVVAFKNIKLQGSRIPSKCTIFFK